MCFSSFDCSGYEIMATLSLGLAVMPSKLLERTRVGFWLILSIPSSLDIAYKYTGFTKRVIKSPPYISTFHFISFQNFNFNNVPHKLNFSMFIMFI